MQLNNVTDINMVIYHNQSYVATCKPDHLGFMGVYVKDVNLDYPVGTNLDVKFIGHKYQYLHDVHMPMIVNHLEADGTGLRLKNFKKDHVNKWQDFLQTVMKPLAPKPSKKEVDYV